MFGMMSDMAKLTGRQCKAGRALIGLSQKELADRAGVFSRTLVDFESGKRAPKPATKTVIAQALASAGVALLDREGVAIHTISTTTTTSGRAA
jgi:transcriptional regulator with XRE-family HTH domain